MIGHRWSLLAGLTLAACGRQAASAGAAALPPPSLAPRLEHFRALAASVPPPAADEVRPARELSELALVPELADARMAAMSLTALRGHAHAAAALEQLLAHENGEVRRGAAAELGRLGDRAAVVPLLMRLKYETDADPRLHVAAALAALGCGAGLDELRAAIDRAELAQAAGELAIDVAARAGIEVGESPTWTDIAAWLRELSDEWHCTGVLRGFAAVAIDSRTRARAAAHVVALEGFQLRPVDDARFVLARMGQAVVPLLAQAVGASETYLRTHALEVLRHMGPAAKAAAAAVLPLLGDPLSAVEAARTLGAMRCADAVPILRRWLDGDDLERRVAAAEALGTIGDRAALLRLRAIMDDDGEPMDVRVMAAFAVALDRPGYEFLQARLRAGDFHAPTVRELIDRVDRQR